MWITKTKKARKTTHKSNVLIIMVWRQSSQTCGALAILIYFDDIIRLLRGHAIGIWKIINKAKESSRSYTTHTLKHWIVSDGVCVSAAHYELWTQHVSIVCDNIFELWMIRWYSNICAAVHCTRMKQLSEMKKKSTKKRNNKGCISHRFIAHTNSYTNSCTFIDTQNDKLFCRS